MDEQGRAALAEYNFNNYQMVTVVNPRKEDYHFLCEGKPYMIKAGSKKRFPGYIASLYIRHMAKILSQDEKKVQFMVDPLLKVEYYKRLVIGVEDLVETTPVEQPEYLKQAPAKAPEDIEKPFADVKEPEEPEEAEDSNEGEPPESDEEPVDSAGFTLNGTHYLQRGDEYSMDGKAITKKEFETAQKEAEGAVSE